MDRFAIVIHPLTNRLETGGKLRLNGSIRLRPNIQQKVAASACNLHQRADQMLGRFEIAVILVVGPSVVGGHASFPEAKLFRSRHIVWPGTGVFMVEVQSLSLDRNAGR